MIDSRDVIARIEELEGERADLSSAVDETGEELETARAASPDDAKTHALQGTYDNAEKALQEWDDDYGDELKALQSLAEDGEGYSDWKHGAQLIRDDYFEKYAQEFAEDIGAIPDDASWPATCIDWEKAAGELQMDYTSLDFAGVTYWVR